MSTTTEHVAALIDRAPLPTAEQLGVLRGLLGPALVAARPEPACRPRPTRPRPAP
jgi:hypothetical protein